VCRCSMSTWSCLPHVFLELFVNQVILPATNRENSYLSLWNLYSTYGTEDIFPSVKIKLPFEGSALPLCILLKKYGPFSAMHYTKSRKLPMASLSLPLTICTSFYGFLTTTSTLYKSNFPRKLNLTNISSVFSIYPSTSSYNPLLEYQWPRLKLKGPRSIPSWSI